MLSNLEQSANVLLYGKKRSARLIRMSENRTNRLNRKYAERRIVADQLPVLDEMERAETIERTRSILNSLPGDLHLMAAQLMEGKKIRKEKINKLKKYFAELN